MNAVQVLLALTEHWAQEAVERLQGDVPIEHGSFERSLGDGVVISMQRTPGKTLTYRLVAETVQRLWAWEMSTGKGKAVEFGILDHQKLRGIGSLKREKPPSVGIARRIK